MKRQAYPLMVSEAFFYEIASAIKAASLEEQRLLSFSEVVVVAASAAMSDGIDAEEVQAFFTAFDSKGEIKARANLPEQDVALVKQLRRVMGTALGNRVTVIDAIAYAVVKYVSKRPD